MQPGSSSSDHHVAVQYPIPEGAICPEVAASEEAREKPSETRDDRMSKSAVSFLVEGYSGPNLLAVHQAGVRFEALVSGQGYRLGSEEREGFGMAGHARAVIGSSPP